MADILYFEVNEKTIGIYTNSKTYYFKNTLYSIEGQINKDFFMRCHRNYIVNCAYIDKISKKGVQLTNKKILPVSQRRIKELKEKFHNFVFFGE
jgi:DNA-binding LytR/AlgR family response regulator